MKLRNVLSEMIQEPSNSIINELVKKFKESTGINIKNPVLSKKGSNYIIYVSNLSKEINTPVLSNVFTDMYLQITVTSLKQNIGGYAFDFHIIYETVDGQKQSVHINRIVYKDNTFTLNTI